MRTNVTSASASIQINPLDAPCPRPAKVTTLYNDRSTPVNDPTTAVNPVDSKWIGALHQVIDSDGLIRKEGAGLLGVDPAQLSRGAVTLDRLDRLPIAMQQKYLELVCLRAGLKVSKANRQDVILKEVRRTVNTLFDLMEVQQEEQP
jgi:hypothetical protein